MKIVDAEKSISIKIDGYEFKDAFTSEDRNWLVVKIEASEANLSWQAKGPFLTCDEVTLLKDYLEQISTPEASSSIDFWENELSFRFDKERGVLTVVLDFSFHPKGASYKYGMDSEYLMQFDLSKSNITSFVQYLGKVAQFYPSRS